MRVPVSAWALLVYAPLLALGLLGLNTPGRKRLALVGGSILVAAAAWFVFVQAVIQRQFCPYCTAMHACGLFAFAYAVSQNWSSDVQQRALALLTTGGVASLTMILILVGQLFGPQPATHEITSDPSLAIVPPTTETSDSALVPPPAAEDQAPRGSTTEGPAAPAPSGPAAADAQPALADASDIDPLAAAPGERVVSYFDGAIRLPLQSVPLIGNPDASHILVKYFDYTCQSCRTMHDDLALALERYPNDLAVIVIPCPLNRECNPYADEHTSQQKGPKTHEFACPLARLGLAVWRADRSKFKRFHDEMFDRQGLMTPKVARIVAESLVGEEALRKAESDPWIDAMLKHSVGVYGQMKARNPRMPKLLLGQRKVLHGVTVDSAAFLNVLRQQLGLGP
jgi:hypothetical protein